VEAEPPRRHNGPVAEGEGADGRWIGGRLNREAVVLLGLGLAGVALFALTSMVVDHHLEARERLGREWFARGESALGAGRPREALEALRTALVYAREDRRAHFRLAQALLADGRVPEARAYLLGLHEREPGGGPVNLALARLEARSGDVAAAARHYRAAVLGTWEDEPLARRVETRFELAELLVSGQALDEAQAELIALAAEAGADAASRTRVGELLLRAGAEERALLEFRAALRRDPASFPALLGAGRAAFEGRDWARAVSYLRTAARERPGDPEAASLLEVAEAVLAADPFRPRLSTAERARRAARAAEASAARVAACLPSADSPELAALAQRLGALGDRVALERALRRDPDRLEPAMDAVFAAERAVAARCGPPPGRDRALLLLAAEPEAAP
jgi:predicted Zn-dependent protease